MDESSRGSAGAPAIEVMPTSGKRLIGIEGLRGAAAVSVMLGHFNLHLVPTEMISPMARPLLNAAGQGLTLFFVLSGFLLFGPFLSAAADGRPFGTRQYFLNRFLRIYPGYVVIFVLVALVFGLAYTHTVTQADAGVGTVSESVGRMTDTGSIAANLLLIHTLLPATIKTGLGVSWSLTAEICFYLLLPLLAFAAVALARRYGLNRAAVIVSFGMIVFGLACRIGGEATIHGDAAAQFYQRWGGNWMAVYLRSILCQADLFGVGMLAVVAYRHSTTITDPAGRRRFRRALYGAALAGLVLTRIEREFGFALFFAAVLLIVTTETSARRPHRLAGLLEWHPVRWLGVISYSFYLWHLPVIWGVFKWQLLGVRPDTLPGVIWTYVVAFSLTTALSAATYLAIERPALLLKSRPGRKRAPAPQTRPVMRDAL